MSEDATTSQMSTLQTLEAMASESNTAISIDYFVPQGKKGAERRIGVTLHNKMLSDGPLDPDTFDAAQGIESMQPLLFNDDEEYYPKYYAESLYMEQVLRNMTGTILVTFNNEQGHQKTMDMPVYGLLSLLLKQSRLYLYDHPEMVKRWPTAFTDGTFIYISAPFVRQLNVEQKSHPNHHGVVFVILHELYHIVKDHAFSLGHIESRSANFFADQTINPTLIKSYPQFKDASGNLLLLPSLLNGVGFDDISADDKSSAIVKYQKAQWEKSLQREASGGSGGGDDGAGDDSQQSEEHFIKPSELGKILHKIGLGSAAQKLGLPAPQKKGESQKDMQFRLKQADDSHRIFRKNGVRKAVQDAAKKQKLCGQLPGSHILEEAQVAIEVEDSPKMSFEIMMRQLVLGDGDKTIISDEAIHMISYLPKKEIGFEIGAIPDVQKAKATGTILCILDTSGSHQESLGESLGEILHIVRSNPGRKVLFACGDTVARGPLQVFDEHNIESFVKGLGDVEKVVTHGGGGTDLNQVMRDWLDHEDIQRLIQGTGNGSDLHAVVMFTDAGDNPPRAELLQKEIQRGIKFAYVISEGSGRNADFIAWQKAMVNEKWCSVVFMEPGATLKMDRQSISHRVTPTKKTRP